MADLHPVQIAKRLVEADGYLELGMPQQALSALEGVENAGQFEIAAQFLRGKAFCAQERWGEAAESLQAAVDMSPQPADQGIWLSLSECYRQAGWYDQAVNSLGKARGAVNVE